MWWVSMWVLLELVLVSIRWWLGGVEMVLCWVGFRLLSRWEIFIFLFYGIVVVVFVIIWVVSVCVCWCSLGIVRFFYRLLMCRLLSMFSCVCGWFLVVYRWLFGIVLFRFSLCGLGWVRLLVCSCCSSGLCSVLVWVFILVVLIMLLIVYCCLLLVVLWFDSCRVLFLWLMCCRWDWWICSWLFLISVCSCVLIFLVMWWWCMF